ncbi:type II RES/Xre toxin-antitoxin system antitoxin [Neolewinella litorea]|uniref:DUF2384 domain-containing protein n=1 Tax=Neolewinella litorea TaxID=2562452 RepID=A0A4S4NP23_9BACT|nr:antitoxin Xre/MbcA/ParS toxin-binding domain-containing protein [Neolewinella litorea]THH41774.1 DUF2384 domain-containing protein [Neolewinella litorea]
MSPMESLLQDIFPGQPLDSRADLIALSRGGISMKEVHRLLAALSLTLREISRILPVSERQLNRYRDDDTLRKDLSSHLIQLVELFEHGYAVFGKDKFDRWVRTENRAVDNNRPIDLLDTPIGIELIGDIVGRVAHGVYS